MTAEYGAATQLEKIDMLDFADLVVINKFDKGGARWTPCGTCGVSIAGITRFSRATTRTFPSTALWRPSSMIQASIGSTRLLLECLESKDKGVTFLSRGSVPSDEAPKLQVIPPERVRYLAEIVESSESRDHFVQEQTAIARRMYQLNGTIELLRAEVGKQTLEIVEPGADRVVQVIEHEEAEPDYLRDLIDRYNALETSLDEECRKLLRDWPATVRRYRADRYRFQVRDRVVEQDLFTESLSGTRVPKVSLPRYEDWGDLLRWLLTENTPGLFPVSQRAFFPLKRMGEDPTRMFAGEGGPEATNRRFHYLSKEMPAKRLSTAFDSVTLYGEDPGATTRYLRQDRQLRSEHRGRWTTPRSSIQASISPIPIPRSP